MDDWKAREVAARCHIPTIGTLGILRDGAAAGLIALEEAIRRLGETTFRAPTRLLESLLKEDAARKPNSA
jgi:predicted nucleic acid-binding protein